MKKTFFLTALSVLLMAACSQDEPLVRQMDNPDAVQFGTFMDRQTKAGEVDLADLKSDGFIVHAYNTDQATWAEQNGDISSIKLMSGTVVTNNGTSWIYEPIVYWPLQGNKPALPKVTFFAYYPLENAALAPVITMDETTGLKFTFTCATDPENQVDFLADCVADQTKESGIVTFEFNHLLSQINFNAKMSEIPTGHTVVVKSCVVDYSNIFMQKTVDVTEDVDINLSNGTLVDNIGLSDNFTSGSIELDATDAALVNKTPLMLLPQTLEANDFVATFILTVQKDELTPVDYEIEVGLPAINWVAGKIYTYNINFGLLEDSNVIEFNVDETTLEDWIDDVTQPTDTNVGVN